ncbi:MAG: DUF3108 domain-containing protein [Candidatus Tectomicrobia bacterium]|uniref:DUF3108 domain-containing protein n=1 Tax=Tectimicrobiota bacterium TaxID=2528274 RepID=A0A932M1N4_UNCTE|nr:DUF3108 domain-containing protein [Candidatus Tectomicrobia bacterium]
MTGVFPARFNRLLKKSVSWFDRLTTNDPVPLFSIPAPFGLTRKLGTRSKAERRVFQHPVRAAAFGATLIPAVLWMLTATAGVHAQDRPSDSAQGRPPDSVRPHPEAGYLVEGRTVVQDHSGPGATALPFHVGEELTFDLTWMGIKGGTATMAVPEKTTWAGVPVYHLVTTAESAPAVSAFYRVEDKVESFVEVRGLFPLYFKSRQQEGKYRGAKDIFFDPQTGKATYRKNQEPTEVFPVPPGVQDALSSFYYLRTLPLKSDAPVMITMFDSKKTAQVEVQILGREKVKTLWGPVQTLKVKPILKTEGIFRRKGDVLIWLTEDFQKLPLRMESKIPIGSIVATLVNIRGANPPTPSP